MGSPAPTPAPLPAAAPAAGGDVGTAVAPACICMASNSMAVPAGAAALGAMGPPLPGAAVLLAPPQDLDRPTTLLAGSPDGRFASAASTAAVAAGTVPSAPSPPACGAGTTGAVAMGVLAVAGVLAAGVSPPATESAPMLAATDGAPEGGPDVSACALMLPALRTNAAAIVDAASAGSCCATAAAATACRALDSAAACSAASAAAAPAYASWGAHEAVSSKMGGG